MKAAYWGCFLCIVGKANNEKGFHICARVNADRMYTSESEGRREFF